MLLLSSTHRISYDLIGPDTGDVVCFAHALLADGGMWADQVSPLLDAGFSGCVLICADTADPTRRAVPAQSWIWREIYLQFWITFHWKKFISLVFQSVV